MNSRQSKIRPTLYSVQANATPTCLGHFSIRGNRKRGFLIRIPTYITTESNDTYQIHFPASFVAHNRKCHLTIRHNHITIETGIQQEIIYILNTSPPAVTGGTSTWVS